jgi:BMFP domain-containing protein YqiC
MAKAKKRINPVGQVRASAKSVGREGMQLVERLRADASKLVARSRAEVLKDVRTLRSEIVGRADRAVRNLERKVVRQFHAATQGEVRRLEARIAKLERRVTELAAKASSAGGEKAA